MVLPGEDTLWGSTVSVVGCVRVRTLPLRWRGCFSLGWVTDLILSQLESVERVSACVSGRVERGCVRVVGDGFNGIYLFHESGRSNGFLLTRN